MGSIVLPDLTSAWHVDQAIVTEEDRIVAIRFGMPYKTETMAQDEVLYKIANLIANWAVIYVCDIEKVKDFNQMYELYDVWCVMFFYRNKHIMVDFGTGNNNKMNVIEENKDDLISIFEVVYKGAKKGKGLVTSPKDYSTRHQH